MPTAVAKPRAIFASDNRPSATFQGHTIDWQSDSTAIVRGVEVFKAGTFRDSWGDQHTWLPEHLALMASNFDFLKNNDIFPNVPTRRDHSFSIDKVMGYIEGLATNGQKLLADIHVTEPTEVDKLARGTYRSVSLEVGMYIDNNETAYWPVCFGVAYVDMPAVEGLHGKQKEVSFFSMIPQGEQMSGQNGTAGASVEDRPPATTINVFGSGQMSTTPGQSNVTTTPAPTTAGSTAPAAPPAAPAPAPAATTFRINGAETVDFAAVQRHIDTLEAVVRTTDEDARKTFVSDLAKAGKIIAAQVEGMQAFALSLQTDSFDAWKKTYEGAQALPIMQPHGNATTNPEAPNTDPAQERISVLKETVAYLYRLMPKEKVEATDHFKELARLTANQS